MVISGFLESKLIIFLRISSRFFFPVIRLEAYIANNQKTIPAIIIDVNEEDALVMSLVENIARKNYSPYELFKNVKKLHKLGYSPTDISEKIGMGKEYMTHIIKLIDRGEERLLNAVENNKIPLNVALQIVETPDSEIQRVLQEAYEQGIIKGNKLNQIQKIIEIRKRSGKNFRPGKFLSSIGKAPNICEIGKERIQILEELLRPLKVINQELKKSFEFI